MTSILKLLTIIGLSVPLAFTGCSNKTTTYPVTGNVSLDGKPIENAAIVLTPVEGGANGYGVSDVKGDFFITTFEKGDGAIPGQHTITVTLQKLTKAVSGKPDKDIVPEEDEGEEHTATEQTVTEWIVPERYSKVQSSGLSTTVASGNEPLKLELTSDK